MIGFNRPTKPQRAWLDDLGRVQGAVEVYLWLPEMWSEILEALR